MITIKINGNEHEVKEGKRLVNAIEDLGYDISHRCGGKAMCTTCRVTFDSTVHLKIGKAERDIFKKNKMFGDGFRLSCQLLTINEMSLTIGMPVSENEWDEAGPRPADIIEP